MIARSWWVSAAAVGVAHELCSQLAVFHLGSLDWESLLAGFLCERMVPSMLDLSGVRKAERWEECPTREGREPTYAWVTGGGLRKRMCNGAARK